MTSNDTTLMVGAAKERIAINEGLLPVEGFTRGASDLFARALVIEAAERFIIVSLELTSLKDYEVERLRSLVCDLAQVSADCVWVCVSHTFSAPHVRSCEAVRDDEELRSKNEMLCHAIEEAVRCSVERACRNIRPVRIGFGQGMCSVNACRDVPSSQGWWLGVNEIGISDHSVPVVRFDDLRGEPVAALFCYDAPSSILCDSRGFDGGKAVCSDLAGFACAHIEQQYADDFVAIFVVGAAGDQTPIFTARHQVYDRTGAFRTDDIGDDAIVLVNALGKRLGDQVVLALERITTMPCADVLQFSSLELDLPGQCIVRRHEDIRPTRCYEFVPDDSRHVEVSFVRLGHMMLVGMAPAINSITAIDIRRLSQFPLTMVMTMVNGGAKYLPDRSAYDRITYEAMNSMYASGSAELLARHITSHLSKMSMDERG